MLVDVAIISEVLLVIFSALGMMWSPFSKEQTFWEYWLRLPEGTELLFPNKWWEHLLAISCLWFAPVMLLAGLFIRLPIGWGSFVRLWRMSPTERQNIRLEKEVKEAQARLKRLEKGEYAASAKHLEKERRETAAIKTQNDLRQQLQDIQRQEGELRSRQLDEAMHELRSANLKEGPAELVSDLLTNGASSKQS